MERTYLRVGTAVLACSALQMAKGFWFLMPAEPAAALLVLGTGLFAVFYILRGCWLVIGASRDKREQLPSRLLCLGGLLATVALFLFGEPYFQGARLRFWQQGGESAYLRFAAEARQKYPQDLPPMPKEFTIEQFEKHKQLEAKYWSDFRASLDDRLLNHHPTAWQGIGVTPNYIQLWSGSGMTGSWGIEIHDQPEIPAVNSSDATAVNPYLPRQKPLSPRVWYWESD